MGIFHSEFLAKSQDDRDKAIWIYLRQRQTCPNCGTRDEEWDPEQGGHRRAYVAEAKICRGCQATQSLNNALTDDDRKNGVQVVLRKRGSGGAKS